MSFLKNLLAAIATVVRPKGGARLVEHLVGRVMLLWLLSRNALNSLVDWISLAIGWSLFQAFAVLFVKKLYLRLLLLTNSLRKWVRPAKFELGGCRCQLTMSRPLSILKRVMRSPLVLLVSSVVSPRAESLCSYVRLRSCVGILVALRCTLSMVAMSFLACGDQIAAAESKCCRMYVVYRRFQTCKRSL